MEVFTKKRTLLLKVKRKRNKMYIYVSELPASD